MEGLDVPGDLKVATCSNGELTRTASPQLTTLDEHPDRLGEAAVEMLVSAILDPESAPSYLEVETDLIVRGSTSGSA
ncbi:MAG TPA: substrate-binding domain-containing protein [Solirubrobacterales bacterium]|nr:substrate-binding domain-containing protein [Solirubrobacterales bacterium]